MKAFVVFVALAISVQALTEEQMRRVIAFNRECSALSGVDQDLIARGRRGDFVDDPRFKEHLFCFSKKAGFQNEAGDIQEDVLRSILNAKLHDLNTTNRLIAKCAIKQATPQDTAFHSVKCYYENTPTHISLA